MPTTNITPIFPEWVEYLKLTISFLTLFPITLAYLSYRSNIKKINDDRKREHSKELTLQFQKSLQWAYDVLTSDGQSIPPKADRLIWLTSARHILRAQKLRSRINNSTYNTVADELEEYWRYKFYTALSHESLMSWTYFADTTNMHNLENIEISSALVVIDFSNWKTGAPDPTDQVDRELLIRKGGGIKGGYAGRGLESYLCRLEAPPKHQ